MLRSTADSQADADRFVIRVAESDTVWYLKSDEGVAFSDSNSEPDDDQEPATVLLFFSDQAYAKRAQRASFPDYRVASMALFEFLYRWLPGMSRDGVLAGPNWTGDLIGLELDPFDLRETITSKLEPDHLARHEKLYQELTGQV